MLGSRVSFLSWILQVVASAALCTAESAAKDDNTKHLLAITDNPVMATWTIFGVIATTTLAVLMILVPTLLYYKYWTTRNGTPQDVYKK